MMRLFSSGTSPLFSSCSSSSFPRTLLLQFSQFSSSSSGHYSVHSSPSSRRHEEESRNIKVSVWWDFENCNLPAGVNAFKVAHFITAAVRANGIKGPVQITAFGDILQLSRANQEALSSTGISLSHIPQGGKNSADRSLLVDLMFWVTQNPPPAHLFLISGDRDFANILLRLRMSNYNVLLASPENAPSVLCSAASIMWPWNSLIRGENLAGRYFNQPPDGPYGSWYGHYKVHLEDPFPRNEQPSCSRAEEVSEPSSDPKPRPVPKTVIRQIRHILKMYPKGLSITDFRSELVKSNVSMDKDYYGYKKFSCFLLSMPHVLKLQKNADGQLILRIVTPRAVESFESGQGTLNETVKATGDRNPNLTVKLNNNGSSMGDKDVPFLSSNELNIQERPVNMQQSSERGKSTCRADEGGPSMPPVSNSHVSGVSKKTSGLEADGNLSSSTKQPSEAENGFLKRIWKWFLGSNDHDHNVSGEPKTEGKTVNSMNPDASSVHPVSYSADNMSAMLQKTAAVSGAYDDKSSFDPGLLGRIREWFKIWRNDTENGKVSEQCFEPNQLRNQSGKHELLSSNSFWQDMESFMETSHAAELVSRSKTRLEMAQNLLEAGPSALKSFSKNDLLDVVEMLILVKKWVEECPSHTKPFKLTLSIARKSSFTKPLCRSNGLTSIFFNTMSQPLDLDMKNENISQAGVSSGQSRFPDRTRSEILGDCQKLVNEILREHPEGYNMGAFRRLFLERYGYHLDLQKLGYQKLASLLQILPGVSVAHTFIVPADKTPKISNLETVLSGNQEKMASHLVANSDDLTDSDAESLPTTQESEMKKKVQIDEEDSSLLQILDSWYSNKEDRYKKDRTEHTDRMMDCSAIKSENSSFSARSETNVGYFARKQRHKKNYSFVSDTDESEKEKLIDGILGTLKKSSKPQMHN